MNSIKMLLFELEKLLLLPAIRKSVAKLSKILAEDFIEFGSSGKIMDRDRIIEALQNESSDIHWSIKDFQVKELAPDVMLATYRAIMKSGDKTLETPSLRSSVWKLIDSHWQMVFHQGTRIVDKNQ